MAKMAGDYLTIDQSNDASGINSKRGMSRRAKRNSSKRDRRARKTELAAVVWEEADGS